MLRSLVLVALLVAPTLARAQARPSSLGEQHYLAGVDAYARQEYRTAAIEFRAAYEITSDPLLLFNLGNALAADGQRDAARDAFQRYLRARPDAPDRAAVEARLHELGDAPLPVAPVPPVQNEQAPPPREVAHTAPPPTLLPTPAPARTSLLPLVGAIVGGAGVVAASVGTALFVDVSGRYSECQRQACPEARLPRGENVAAVALLWGGGAVAVAGLVTFLVGRRAASPSARATQLTLHPGGIGIAGTF